MECKINVYEWNFRILCDLILNNLFNFGILYNVLEFFK